MMLNRTNRSPRRKKRHHDHRCKACGEEWPRDPAFEVEWPDCKAGGSPCRRPSGHVCAIHASRDRLAMEMGLLAPCPAATRHPSQQAAETPQLARSWGEDAAAAAKRRRGNAG